MCFAYVEVCIHLKCCEVYKSTGVVAVQMAPHLINCHVPWEYSCKDSRYPVFGTINHC